MQRFLRLVSLVSIGCAGGVSGLWAQLVAEPASVDLGRRAQNVVAEATVVLVNTGTQPVTILDVAADCSCTAGTPGKQSLAPGERTELSIKTETRTYQGEVTRRVVVRTAEGELAVPVKVRVTPYERWEVKPPFLTLAPSVRGQAATGSVVLEYLGAGPVGVGKVTAEPAWVAGGVAPADGGRPGEFVVTLNKRREAPAGHHLVKMTAETTDAVNPRVTFNVFLSVESALRVKPSPLVLPVGKAGVERHLKAELIGWDGDLPPRFELAKGTVAMVGPAANGGGGLAFEIAITPDKAGAMTQLLRIYRGDELELEVPVIVRAE